MIRPALASARLGAVCYILWALLHLTAAASVYGLGVQAGKTMIGGRLLQEAFILRAFSGASAGVAIGLNWRNARSGFWINLTLIGVADVGFILFVILPGYAPLWPSLAGPILWVLGAVLTAHGRRARSLPA
jgi:hypothetical protein